MAEKKLLDVCNVCEKGHIASCSAFKISNLLTVFQIKWFIQTFMDGEICFSDDKNAIISPIFKIQVAFIREIFLLCLVCYKYCYFLLVILKLAPLWQTRLSTHEISMIFSIFFSPLEDKWAHLTSFWHVGCV